MVDLDEVDALLEHIDLDQAVEALPLIGDGVELLAMTGCVLRASGTDVAA